MSYPVEQLLPHAGAMVLLDQLVEVGENHIVTSLSVRDDGLFSSPDYTVPAWVGLEYMAQTVAAFSGYYRRQAGLEIELGFLLGTRYYESSVSAFPCGVHLRVLAERVMEAANDMSVFACTLTGENIGAESRLNLFLPRDSKAYLKGKGA